MEVTSGRAWGGGEGGGSSPKVLPVIILRYCRQDMRSVYRSSYYRKNVCSMPANQQRVSSCEYTECVWYYYYYDDSTLQSAGQTTS